MVLVTCKELTKPMQRAKPKSSDLNVIESQEHNFLESPSSYKRYQQNNNAYNEEGGSVSFVFNFFFNFLFFDFF